MRPRRCARFFVSPNGVCREKARPLTDGERGRLWDSLPNVCAICRRPVKRFRCGLKWGDDLGQVDHILPRSRGGTNNPQNLRILCECCNCSIQDYGNDSEARGLRYAP